MKGKRRASVFNQIKELEFDVLWTKIDETKRSGEENKRVICLK